MLTRPLHLAVTVATVVFILVILTMTSGQAGQVQLSWIAPTKDAKGMPLTDLAGYKVYYGENTRQVSGSYQHAVDVGNRTSFMLTGLTDGKLYYFAVTAYDTDKNESAYTDPEVSAIASSPSLSPIGLVAAYNFNEGSGTTLNDRSGTGNHGTISNATWTTAGRYGKALVFNGTSSWVTIADAVTLDLTSGMTLEAWIYPTTTTGVRDVLCKEGSKVDIYNLYARNWRGQPEINTYVSSANRTAEGAGLVANVWTHLAGTYDGSLLRLYRNGVEVARKAQSGPVATSAGVVRIGGNSLWGEFFRGSIDEVRIYKRALTPSEIQADMNTPVN